MRKPNMPTAVRIEPMLRRLADATLRDLKKTKAESKRLRAEANYVNSTPRCGNCMNMQLPLTNKHGQSTGKVCRLLACTVQASGLCDWWTGNDGSTLE